MSNNANILRFSCIVLAVIKPSTSVNVTHVPSAINWLQASDVCGKEGLEYRESIFKTYGILQEKMFWIGKAVYNKTSDWFEILDCYTVTDTTGMKELVKISSLGQCQIKCQSLSSILPKNETIYFGYNETSCMCICAKNTPPVKLNIRNCTSKTHLNAYFFYKVYQETVSAGTGGHCTTLNCANGYNNLKAVNCFHTLAAGRCGYDELITRPWGNTYTYYLNACKSKNQLLLSPSAYCKPKAYNYQGIESWTNVFRKVYEDQQNKAEAENEIPLKCLAGQIVYTDGKLNLTTTKMNCNIGLHWFVCRKAETQSSKALTAVNFQSTTSMTIPKSKFGASSASLFTTSTSMAKSKTKKNPSPTSSNQKQQGEFRSTRITERNSFVTHSTALPELTKHSKKPSHQNNHSENGRDSKTIGAVVGGLLGACSVIALFSVLIVCKVRSIGLFKQSSKHNKEERSQMQFSKAAYQDSNDTTETKSTPTRSNETYGLAENSKAVYAVVNKTKTPKINNEIYTDAAYGEYDHLHDIQNRKMCQQESLYHSHRSPQNEEDQTYDSSDFGVGKCTDGNGLYDQSISLVEEEYSYSTHTNLENTTIDMGIYDKAS